MAENNSSAPLKTAEDAAQRDELLQVAIDFIGTLTGMKPPPIEVAPPEVFAPFRAFVERVQAITRPPQAVAAQAAPAEGMLCGVCGADEAFTGSCGGGRSNPRALCFERAALAATPEIPAAGDSSAGDLAEAVHASTYVQPVPDHCDRIVWHGQYIHLPIAQAEVQAEPVALPFAILGEEMVAFRRFDECVRDGQGYDVHKPMMRRLAEIGLVRRVSADIYEHTTFGCSVIHGDFDTAPQAQPADALDAKRWRDHIGKLDALVTYCPTCCQGFTAKPEMTRDEVIFECGKTVGRSAAMAAAQEGGNHA